MAHDGPIEQQKHVFHSALRDETTAFGGYAGVIGKTSTHNKTGKTLLDFRCIKGNMDQVLWPETDAIGRRFEALSEQHKGETLLIKAFGARDKASIRVFTKDGTEITPEPDVDPFSPAHAVPAGGPSQASPPPREDPWSQGAQAPAQAPAAPRSQAEPAAPPPKVEGWTTTEAKMVAALVAAAKVVTAVTAELGRAPTELEQKVAVTLFIEGNRGR